MTQEAQGGHVAGVPRRAGYQVSLDVYSGPFDVLLQLITERRVDVCDVPIAALTEEYLATLSRMEAMDLEVTTEFLVVASSLLQLKARALLPAGPGGEEAAQQDEERDLLIARLLEIRTFQGAGALLAGRLAEGDRLFPAAPASDDPALRVMPTLADISPAALAGCLVEMIRGMVTTVDLALLVADEVSTEDAVSDMMARLSRGPLTFGEAVSGRTLAWAVALFLAMLELSARGEVALSQGERLGDIEIDLLERAS